jgi:hypothetical protein
VRAVPDSPRCFSFALEMENWKIGVLVLVLRGGDCGGGA